MDARRKILDKLRQAQRPFTDVKPIKERRHMIVSEDLSPDERMQLFVSEAEKLGCFIYQLDQSSAVEQIMELIGGDQSVLSWDENQLPMKICQACWNPWVSR